MEPCAFLHDSFLFDMLNPMSEVLLTSATLDLSEQTDDSVNETERAELT